MSCGNGLVAQLRVKAQPMVIDEQAELWRPVKTKHMDPMSIISIEVGVGERDRQHYIVAHRISDNKEILRCLITSDLLYNEASRFFHHWSTTTAPTAGPGSSTTGSQHSTPTTSRHGLTFINLANAAKFRDQVAEIRDALNGKERNGGCDARDTSRGSDTSHEPDTGVLSHSPGSEVEDGRSHTPTPTTEADMGSVQDRMDAAPGRPSKPVALLHRTQATLLTQAPVTSSHSISSASTHNQMVNRLHLAPRSHSHSTIIQDHLQRAHARPDHTQTSHRYKPQLPPPLSTGREDDDLPQYPPPRLPVRSSSSSGPGAATVAVHNRRPLPNALSSPPLTLSPPLILSSPPLILSSPLSSSPLTSPPPLVSSVDTGATPQLPPRHGSLPGSRSSPNAFNSAPTCLPTASLSTTSTTTATTSTTTTTCTTSTSATTCTTSTTTITSTRVSAANTTGQLLHNQTLVQQQRINQQVITLNPYADYRDDVFEICHRTAPSPTQQPQHSPHSPHSQPSSSAATTGRSKAEVASTDTYSIVSTESSRGSVADPQQIRLPTSSKGQECSGVSRGYLYCCLRRRRRRQRRVPPQSAVGAEQLLCQVCDERFYERDNERGACSERRADSDRVVDTCTCTCILNSCLQRCTADAEGRYSPAWHQSHQPHNHHSFTPNTNVQRGRRRALFILLGFIFPCIWCYTPCNACQERGKRKHLWGARHTPSKVKLEES